MERIKGPRVIGAELGPPNSTHLPSNTNHHASLEISLQKRASCMMQVIVCVRQWRLWVCCISVSSRYAHTRPQITRHPQAERENHVLPPPRACRLAAGKPSPRRGGTHLCPGGSVNSPSPVAPFPPGVVARAAPVWRRPFQSSILQVTKPPSVLRCEMGGLWRREMGGGMLMMVEKSNLPHLLVTPLLLLPPLLLLLAQDERAPHMGPDAPPHTHFMAPTGF